LKAAGHVVRGGVDGFFSRKIPVTNSLPTGRQAAAGTI